MTYPAPAAGAEDPGQNQLPSSTSETVVDPLDLGTETGEDTPQKTFSSDDVEKIVRERLARQRNQYGGDPASIKALKAELEQIKQSGLSDQEKAIAKAKSEAREEVEREFREKLVVAKLESALTGVVESPSDFVANLKVSNYVDENGDFDSSKVDALKQLLPSARKPSAPRTHGHSSNGQVSPQSAQDAFVEFAQQFTSSE